MNEYERVLYHVTPMYNQAGIAAKGVDPLKAQGRMKASWWVDERRLMWALAHVSAKWCVAVCDLVVYSAPYEDDGAFKRWSREGLYTCGTVKRPTQKKTATEALEQRG